MQDTTTLTLPIPPDTLAILALVVAVAALSYLAYRFMPRHPDDTSTPFLEKVATALGLSRAEPLVKSALFLALWAYGIIFVIAVVISLRALGGILLLPLPEVIAPTEPRLSLAFGTLLAAILGAPFIIWRSWIAAKQTAVAEESLFNDKINAAATGLAARRQVTRVMKDADGIETILTEWEDDLVTRAAAIDRLEGLAGEAFDKRDYATPQRIARMLSIYVQELSRAYPAKEVPEDTSPDDLSEWAWSLTPIRPDMERAAQSLGRINPANDDARAAFNPKNIDLRNCNLQAFDLIGLNFQEGQLDQAQMQGASLHGAQMQGAKLTLAQMQGADLDRAQMQGADLFEAQIQGASLDGAQMQGASLFGAQMQGASLIGAQMQGADIIRAQMQGAKLTLAQMQGADISDAQMQGARLVRAQMQGARLVRAQMQGTDLSGAQMQGAVLSGAQMSEDTDLTAATLRGAAVRSVDDTTLARLQAHDDWDAIFRPDGNLEYETFTTQWSAFAAALDPPVTIAPDYQRTD